MDNIIIRQYSDIDEPFLNKMTYGKYAEELNGYSRNNIMVAEYNGSIAGYSYARIRSGEGMMSFIFVFVSQEYRQHGVGSALYKEVENRCIESGSEALFTSYFDKETADTFIKKHNFSYSTSSSIMKYSEGLIPEKEFNIRKYTDDDFLRFDYIWSRGDYEMHKRIGLPVSEITGPSEDIRQQYSEDADNIFILEDCRQIIGGGSIVGANIGSLAVDMSLHNRGYGTALAIFLTNEILRRGYSDAFLYCETDNDNARHVYEKIGYKALYSQYDAVKYLK